MSDLHSVRVASKTTTMACSAFAQAAEEEKAYSRVLAEVISKLAVVVCVK